MRGVCAELTLCGGETYAKVSNIGLQMTLRHSRPSRSFRGATLAAPE
jgi:hypothetical protein